MESESTGTSKLLSLFSISSPTVNRSPSESMSSPISCEGWLWKFSVGHTAFGVRNWKRRYFQSDEYCARYYTDETLKNLKGVINYANMVRLFPTAAGAGTPPELKGKDVFIFAIQFTNKSSDLDIQLLMLAAETSEEMEKWVQELQDRFLSASKSSGANSHFQADIAPEEDIDEDEVEKRAHTAKFANVGVTQGAFSGFLNSIRLAVSGNKRRIKLEDYDLDLTYVTPRIVAMGYPSEGGESLYRNPMTQVVAFLDQQHSSHYMVYNLCSERAYAPTSFEGRFERYPFDDHSPPPLELISTLTKNAQKWLDSDPENIIVIHCKAGKGRTGLAVACLLSVTESISGEEALKLYNSARTVDGKGVTIPSQIRYVHYFDRVRREFGGQTPPAKKITLKKFAIHSTPHFDMDGGCDPYIIIRVREENHKHRAIGQDRSNVHNPLVVIYDSRVETPARHELGQELIQLSPVNPLTLQGDIKMTFMDADVTADEVMFTFWFHTSMLSQSGVLVLEKNEVDGASKDKKNAKFDPHFRVVMYYSVE